MRYFVIGDDGQKYGPADVGTLQAWVAEGRLLPNQQVEEEGSGIRMAAAAVNGLNFPNQGPPQAQQASPYQQPSGTTYEGAYVRPGQVPFSGDTGQQDVTLGWVFGVLGLLICCLFEPAGLFFAHRAVEKGHPGGKAAKIFCIVVLCLQVVGLIAYALFAIYLVKNGVTPSQMQNFPR